MALTAAVERDFDRSHVPGEGDYRRMQKIELRGRRWRSLGVRQRRQVKSRRRSLGGEPEAAKKSGKGDWERAVGCISYAPDGWPFP